MTLHFSQEQIDNELNKIYLEEDDLLMEAESLEGDGKVFSMTGIATIDGERYLDFVIEFELEEPTPSEKIEEILSAEWDWYHFPF